MVILPSIRRCGRPIKYMGSGLRVLLDVIIHCLLAGSMALVGVCYAIIATVRANNGMGFVIYKTRASVPAVIPLGPQHSELQGNQ